LRFIDLYAGIGGFRLGFEREGHECVWSCEIDKYCRQVYRYRFGETPAGDVREVDPESIPEFELLLAGFPCQSFSLAGERRGFEDTRGTLFHEICRVLRVRRPPHCLLENVEGLLSTQDREAFRVVLQSLDGLGYDAEWQVLNSKDFGVPQNRPRVFITGHLRGEPRPEVLPIARGEGEVAESGERESEGGKEGLEPVMIDFGSITPRNLSNSIQSSYKKGIPNSQGRIGVLVHDSYPDFRTYDRESPSISTPCGGRHLPFVLQKSPDWREDGTLREFSKVSPAIRERMGDNLPMMLEHRGRKAESPKLINESPSLRRESHGHQPKVLVDCGFQKSAYSPSGISPTVREGHGDVVRIAERFGPKQSGGVYSKDGISPTVSWGKRGPFPHHIVDGNKNEPVFVGGLEKYRRLEDGKNYSRNFRQGGRIYSSKGISPSLSADSVGGAGGETGLFVTGVTLANKSRYEQGVDRTPLQKDNLSWALNKFADQGVLTEDVEIRKLTPVECERLQGFPDGWTERGLTEDGERVEISDTQRYKMLGNAVTVNVVEFLAERYRRFEEEKL